MGITENDKALKNVRRGYVPTDERDFGEKNLAVLRKAAEEIFFLLNRGYAVKNASVFVGNHYQLTERQRLALARSVSAQSCISLRKEKQLSDNDIAGGTLHIDGFNTVITLETAFSGSPLFMCMDGTVRDLAGLRGTYRIIDKTETALQAVADSLDALGAAGAVFYLDAPVSNSGRLKERILEICSGHGFETEVRIEKSVDPIIEKCSFAVTSDAIILDKCKSWYDLTGYVIRNRIGNYNFIKLFE